MRPLTLGDLGRAEAWAEERATRYADALTDGLAGRLGETVCQTLADLIALGRSGPVAGLLDDSQGTAYRLWLSARRDHPEVTPEQMAAELHGQDGIALKRVLRRLAATIPGPPPVTAGKAGEQQGADVPSVFAGLAERYSWTMATIEALTLGQLDGLANRPPGQRMLKGRAVQRCETIEQAMALREAIRKANT